MSHIADTHFRYGSAGDLLSYISHEGELQNRVGETMGDREIQEFVDKSEQHEFERDIIVSPERDDLSDREISEAVRDSVTEYFDNAGSVDFCYSVHRDTESLHAHVALTGEKDDLYMNQTDLGEFKQISEQQFEQVQSRDREIFRENSIEVEQRHDRDREQDQDRERGRSL